MKKRNPNSSRAEQLVKAIKDSGFTRYEIFKATGINQSILSRLVHGAWIGRDKFDVLCEFLGLEWKLPAKRKKKR